MILDLIPGSLVPDVGVGRHPGSTPLTSPDRWGRPGRRLAPRSLAGGLLSPVPTTAFPAFTAANYVNVGMWHVNPGITAGHGRNGGLSCRLLVAVLRAR